MPDVALQNPASRRALQRLCSHRPAPRSPESAGGPSPATLSRWFAALSSLNHWATSLQELYVQAARCAVEAIGLDSGIVLRRRDGEWEVAARHLAHPDDNIQCDPAALDALLASPQTWFHGTPSEEPDEPAIVVAPLQNANSEVVGAVYGSRSLRNGNARRTIRYLEAHMIELLAGAVSQGIARIERDAEIDCRRVLLERATGAIPGPTGPVVAAEQRVVTLLFADLRGSTALAATLEAGEMYELMSQVLESLSAAVIDHDGLIIDYYGDGLSAMWNAPLDQADHADLACRAAVRMLQAISDVSSDWFPATHRELQLGIGIHTGAVHVGNTGSRRRTKYGPRGTTVNLTSRIEAATKQLQVPLLLTSETAKLLSNRFAVHRLCRARIVGFNRCVELYAHRPTSRENHDSAAWHAYEEAMRRFEQGQLQQAVEILATIDADAHEMPVQFMIDYFQRELSRAHCRRSTDRENENLRGVVRLGVK